MIKYKYGEEPNHFKASSMAATSASKAVCFVRSVLAPWVMVGPAAQRRLGAEDFLCMG
jgi:hypothetical protein